MKGKFLKVLFSLMLLIGIMPFNKVHAEDVDIKPVVITNRITAGQKASSIALVESDCTLKIGDYDTEIKPELLGVYTNSFTDSIYKVAADDVLELNKLYFLHLKYDLNNVSIDVDTYLNSSNTDINFLDDSFIGYTNMFLQREGYSYEEMEYLFVESNYKYKLSDNKELELFMGVYAVPTNTENDDENIVEVVSSSSNSITFKVEGTNLPDATFVCLYKKTYASLLDWYNDGSPEPDYLMYSYVQGNPILLHVEKEGLENYGHASINSGRTCGYYQFVTEDGVTFDNGDYTAVLFYKSTPLDNSFNQGINVFNFTLNGEPSKETYLVTFKADVFDGVFDISSEKVNIEDLMLFMTGEDLGVDDENIYYHNYIFSTEDVETDSIFIINGEQYKNYALEDLYTHDFSIIENAIFSYEDTFMAYRGIDFTLLEYPNKSNNFTLGFNDSVLSAYEKYLIKWQHEINYTPFEAELNKSDTSHTVVGDYKTILTSQDGEIKLLGDDETISKLVDEDGYKVTLGEIAPFKTSIVIQSEKLVPGVQITFDAVVGTAFFGYPIAEIEASGETIEHTNVDTLFSYAYTLTKEDIVNNSVKINFSGIMQGGKLYNFKVVGDGTSWVDEYTSKMYLKNPQKDINYRVYITDGDKRYINHELLEKVLLEDDEPAPTSGGSKSYKAKDEQKTAEKISGSGKKGSKRTITPQEGRKVFSVDVKDKNGNKVDVTLNADGTYSFIQPASDVTVEVNYKNREITLNIGSTEASVDGERETLDVSPVIRNDRTMLPIRFVAENLGAKVEWSEKNPNYVVITRGDTKIEITLGSGIMKVNGKDVKLDSVAFAENDRTYLPVRAVSEALNSIVEWNESEPSVVRIYERQ